MSEDAREETVRVEAKNEPPTKKLRYSDPDLRVVVRFAAGEDGTNVNNNNKEYNLYSAVLANLSNFFDVTLSTPMREKETKTITLPDVSPDIFEAALKFEQDTIAARNMTAQDVVQVLEFYDKYEFKGGLHLCNYVLVEYFQKHLQYHAMMPPDDLDVLVDAVVLAERCNLKEALEVGVNYVRRKLGATYQVPYGSTMFTLEHIQKLQPLIVKKILPSFLDITEEETKSTLYPRLLAQTLRDQVTHPKVWTVTLRGSGGCGADGDFSLVHMRYAYEAPDRKVRWNNKDKAVSIEPSPLCNNDWAIVAKKWGNDEQEEEEEAEDLVLWKCPNSGNLMFPPAKPWVPVDKLCYDVRPKIVHSRVVNQCLSRQIAKPSLPGSSNS